jgi:hypothetical protein
MISNIWPRKGKLIEEMFEYTGAEKRMKLCFFDIPELHLNNSTGKHFIQALNETEDIEIFSQMSVQAVVNYHWRQCS